MPPYRVNDDLPLEAVRDVAPDESVREAVVIDDDAREHFRHRVVRMQAAKSQQFECSQHFHGGASAAKPASEAQPAVPADVDGSAESNESFREIIFDTNARTGELLIRIEE